MKPRKSGTLEQLELVLDAYDPDQHTATTMTINGPADLIKDELLLLAHGAALFCVETTSTHDHAKGEARVTLEGTASRVAELVAFMDSQLKAAASAR